MAPRQHLTHFLCIPLGHHPALFNLWTRISTELLRATPPIPGIHQSILVPARGLHLTLGVLSLASEENQPTADVTQGTSQPPRHTVSDALSLLQSLREPIASLVQTPLMVPLERMDVMNSNPERAHVLWAGPDIEMHLGEQCQRVCELVHGAFLEAGMLQDTRPLKLHCTLVNTVYRRPRGKRVPFSCTAIRESEPYKLMTGGQHNEDDGRRPWRIDLGTWLADEVQLCEMGRMENGAYRNVGAISLGREGHKALS